MASVLFVQGGGEGAYDAWDNRLVDSLRRELGTDFIVSYPRMPDEAEPDYVRWKDALAKEIARLGEGAILVGHSIGAMILIHALATGLRVRALRGIFLVAAPFVGEGGWPSGDIEPQKNLGADFPDGVPVFLYHGDEDETAPVAHVDLYAKAIPQAVVRRLEGRDHQLNDDLGEVARDIRAVSAR